MMKTVVYEGEKFLGEVEVYFENRNKNNIEIILMKGMKISHYTKESKRCSPLSVLHTITSNGIGAPYFKMMESSNNKMHNFQQEQKSQLFALHAHCLNDNKTAVFLHGEQEIHLVAMRSRRTNGLTVTPCFWGFCVMPGLYESCLGLLNLRCLGIVFDLDETLIVANTLRSFEDKIGALLRKICVETDHEKIAGMTAEMKRYQEDKALLKQYAESDQVLDNGKVHKIQAEVIPSLSDNHQTVVRPLIRLQDKNIVLTRINPKNPDTSVLVRLRPGWKELSNYLSAKGRKRFEVYVCTMAERDYALEMWRLLDPDSNLISSSELLDRIVCVKSGSKKSLLNVFHGGICHPKMALVIDDRLEVWDEKDQPRVHVVPAFAPYYAPQAEANNTIQVLSVARNVACNVRGGFFKDFDESLLQRTSEVLFEDDPKDIALPPDVSNYLVAENKGFGFNGNEELTCFNGMADVELKRRLTEAAISASFPSVTSSTTVNFDTRMASSLPFAVTTSMTTQQPPHQASIAPLRCNLFSQAGPLGRSLGNFGPLDIGLHNSPACEEGEIPESELDPDTRRRLLILQHGKDTRENIPSEPPFSVRPTVQAPVAGPSLGPALIPGPVLSPVSWVQSRENWFSVEEHTSTGRLSRLGTTEFPIPPDVLIEKQHLPISFPRKVDSSVWSDRTSIEKQRLPREASRRDDTLPSNYSLPNYQSFQGNGSTLNRSASRNKDFEVESERSSSLSRSFLGALHDIAMKCKTKVEFKSGLVASQELKFSMEAYFSGEKIGEGTGLHRREAQQRAAEAAMMSLAERYLVYANSDTNATKSDTSRGQSESDVRFVTDTNSHVDCPSRIQETVAPSSEPTRLDDSHVDGSKNSGGSTSVLKELCMREDLTVNSKDQSPISTNPVVIDQIHAEVEVNGQVVGEVTGSSSDKANLQAAEPALASLKSMLGQFTKRPSSPRSVEGMPNKRLKQSIHGV